MPLPDRMSRVLAAFITHGDVRNIDSATYACERWCPDASVDEVTLALALLNLEPDVDDVDFADRVRRWRREEYRLAERK